MTETEVAALLEYHMRTLGAYSTSFDTIVAFGPHAAVPHHETGDTRLKFGDEILIDFGCKVDGYCSDITRTFLFGDDREARGVQKGVRRRPRRARAGQGKARFRPDGKRRGRDRAGLPRKGGLRKIFYPFPRARHRAEHPRISVRAQGRDGRIERRHGVFGRARRVSRGRIRRPHRGYDHLARRQGKELHAQDGQESRRAVSRMAARRAGRRNINIETEKRRQSYGTDVGRRYQKGFHLRV